MQQDPQAPAAKDARRHALSFLIQHGLTSTDLLHTKIVEYQRTEFSNKIDKLLEYIIDTRKLDRQNTNKVQRQDLCVEIYKVLGFRYLDSEFINRLILSACVLALDCSLPLNYAGSSPLREPQKRNNSISRKPVVPQSGYFAGSESNIPAKAPVKVEPLLMLFSWMIRRHPQWALSVKGRPLPPIPSSNLWTSLALAASAST